MVSSICFTCQLAHIHVSLRNVLQSLLLAIPHLHLILFLLRDLFLYVVMYFYFNGL